MSSISLDMVGRKKASSQIGSVWPLNVTELFERSVCESGLRPWHKGMGQELTIAKLVDTWTCDV
jgi:hypothetical protein